MEKTMHSAANSFSREISSHFDSYFEKYELATSYVEMLLILLNEQKISQNELAKNMNLAPSTITRFANKLVKKDLVIKKKEGRTAVIALSKKGLSLAPEMSNQYDRAVMDLQEVLGEKYVHTIKPLLLHGAGLLREKSEDGE